MTGRDDDPYRDDDDWAEVFAAVTARVLRPTETVPLPGDVTDPPPVTLEQMLATGATYRQIDHWTRLGILTPGGAGQGSGHSRVWSLRDLHTAATIIRLCDAGLTLATARRAADEAWVTGSRMHRLSDTVTVLWQPPPLPGYTPDVAPTIGDHE